MGVKKWKWFENGYVIDLFCSFKEIIDKTILFSALTDTWWSEF